MKWNKNIDEAPKSKIKIVKKKIGKTFKPELKPCPFCGGKAILRKGKSQRCQLHGDKIETFVVECRHKDTKFKPETNEKLPDCFIKPQAFANSKEQAITAWNTRASFNKGERR